MRNAFLSAVDRTNEWVGRIIAWWMIPMIFIMTFEVFMRYVWKDPTEWGTEFVTFLFAGYILLGGGYALLHKDHVNINVIYNRFSPRNRAVLDLLTFVIFFLYAWVLLVESWKFAWSAIEVGRRSGTDWNPPLTPVLLTLPIGAFLVLVQGVAKFIRDLATAFAGKEPSK
jgi:TRAP-type mannitol/chloroaromatic compound transport system permease small subunit